MTHLRTWNTTSPGAPATERETDAYDLGFRAGWRDRGEDRVTEAAPPPDTALREAARAAVEPHLMRIVNRTKPMDQAEGLAILADLDAALTETDHAAGVTLDRRPVPPEPALLGDERGVTLDAQSTANDAKTGRPAPDAALREALDAALSGSFSCPLGCGLVDLAALDNHLATHGYVRRADR